MTEEWLGQIALETTRIHSPVLSSETLLNTKHIPKTGKAGFQVQLGALREECWLPVVIEFEKGGSPFDLRLDEARWCDFDEAF